MFMTRELTAEQRLNKAVAAILNNPRYTALSGVLMVGTRTVADDIPTARTNGRDEEYGRAFVEKITDAQLRFVVLHEVYHKMYRHLITWRHLHRQDPTLANMACDFVINYQIFKEDSSDFIQRIEGICHDAKYAGMTAQQVFNLLKQEQEQQQEQQEQQEQGGQGQGDGGQSLDEHDWEGAQQLTEDEERELAREIDTAIRQGILAANKLGHATSRDLQTLTEPKIDWREVLREFISATCAGKDFSTWRRPNRRFISTGVYMPSGLSERVEELVVAVDTSGSIGGDMLTAFLSEVVGICDMVRPERVRLLYWGSSVVGDEVYTVDNLSDLAASTKPLGGGGTDVNCVTAYMQKHTLKPQAAVCLTDGYLYNGWGEWPCPVMWCVVNNKAAVPTVGKIVHI